MDFLSRADGDAKSLFRTFPGHGPIGLRVLVASPDYLFAMKCLAMRIGEADREGDLADIRRLGRTIGIRSAEDAIHRNELLSTPRTPCLPRRASASRRFSEQNETLTFRPLSIAEIAERSVAATQLFDLAVREFLDSWASYVER